jgi:hypothetical protein
MRTDRYRDPSLRVRDALGMARHKKEEAEIESQDPQTGKWADETAAETKAADKAGVPVADAPEEKGVKRPDLSGFIAAVKDLHAARTDADEAHAKAADAQARIDETTARLRSAADHFTRAAEALADKVGD